jgi:hypothetical protein
MTTPQGMLFDIHTKINELRRMFDGDEDEIDFFEAVKQIHLTILDLATHQQNLENQMNLIIKLLSKDSCDK